jgi:hypothetical protein
MKRSFHEKDVEIGIKSLEDMMKFVAMMLRETTVDEHGEAHQVCDSLKLKKENFKQFKNVAMELFSENKTLKWENNHLMFNGQDISQEGQWIAESYVKQDFAKMGSI